MAELIDDVAHLTEEVGFRPAGTEEEQQTALYLAEELQKRSGFATVIEDFQCSTQPHMVRAICFALAFIATLVAVVVPSIALPCLVVLLIAGVLYALEVLNKPVLSNLFRRGVSQNVVAKYQPAAASGVQRRRKVILVANYDSGKVCREEDGVIGQNLDLIQKASAIALAVAFVLLFIRTVFLAGVTGAVAIFFNILLVVCAILFALPIVRAILFQTAEYSASANNNASGAAVLLDVASRVASGLVSNEEAQALAAQDPTTIHGEEAAREAGVVPEGAALEYDAVDTMSPQESLAAAKAAIAALTGQPIADKVPITDISAHLVQGGGLYPEDESASSMKFEVGEPAAQPASAKPARTTYHVNDDEPVDVPRETEEAPEAEEAAPAVADEAAAQSESIERSKPEALLQGHTGMGTAVDKTPSWARAAQAKARANKGELQPSAPAARSRYADTVAAHLTNDAIHGTSTAAAMAAPADPADEAEAAAPVAVPEEPQSPLAQRLAALRNEIQAAEAPHISEKTQSVLDSMATPAASAAPQFPAEAVATAAAAPAAVALEQLASQASSAAPEQAAVAEEPAPVAPVAEQSAAADSTPVEPSATAAISPIDVSAYLNKDASADEVAEVAPAASAEVPAAQDQPAPQPSPESARVSAAATNRVSATEIQEALKDAAGADAVPAAPVAAEPIDEEPASVVATEPAAPAQEAPASPEPATAPVAAAAPAAAVPAAEAEPVAPVAPIVGMDAMTQVLPSVDTANAAEADHQVIVLPDVDASMDQPLEETKQRAPMADITDGVKADHKSALLSNMLPRITGSFAAVSSSDEPVDTFGLNLPALGNTDPGQSAVSATGSFSTVGGTGSFAPVSDDLVADVDPEEMYVDDADDSAFDQDHTVTGAFAGPGYVDMPKSRAGRLFGRFRKKKKNQVAEPTVSEWVDVDEDYTAREVGKARGDWSSFRQGDADAPADNASEAGATDNGGFVDVDYGNSDFDRRGWNGGAFSLDRLRRNKKPVAAEEYIEEDDFYDGVSAAEDAEVSVTDRAANEAPVSAPAPSAAVVDANEQVVQEMNREMQRLQNFRHPDINTEVWFVGLGAEMYGHEGIKAFMAEHADELKGAIIVNLEALGAGDLSFIESEGQYMPQVPSSRLKRIIRQAAERSGVPCASATLPTRTTAATIAMANGHQAFTVAGVEGKNTALYSSADDVLDSVDEGKMAKASDFVMAILKSI